MDEEKLKTIGIWIIKIVMAAGLIKIMWDVIMTQHNAGY
jgi:hypothetical protein